MYIDIYKKYVIIVDGGSDGELCYKSMENGELEMSALCSNGFHFGNLAAAEYCCKLINMCGYKAHVMPYYTPNAE